MKLSIITINYNNAAGLKKTLDSVAIQTYTDFEHIIVDGASSDGSVDVIREYEQSLASNLSPLASRLKWISEKDTGIYNAMNKGIYMAIGEYLLFLNSGDYLVDKNVLTNVCKELDGIDIIQGNIIEDYPKWSCRYRGYGKSNITFIDVINGHFLHQATFFYHKLFETYGMYEDKFKKCSDTYFYIRCLGLGNATFKYVDIDIANFDTNGISSMKDPKWIQIDKEEDAIWYGENFSKRLIDFYTSAPHKINLYDTLKQNKFIWKIVCLLVKLTNYLYKTESKIKREIIR